MSGNPKESKPPKDKIEDIERERPPKPPGYRKFERLLREVVKSPPMPKRNSDSLAKT
jgi:hypothetical protein